MTLNEYQDQSEATAVYPGYGKSSVEAMAYLTIALCGEVGEFANVYKKVLRDGETEEKREKLILEAGDALWYLARIAKELGVSLEDMAKMNLEKLVKRKAEGKIHSTNADGSR